MLETQLNTINELYYNDTSYCNSIDCKAYELINIFRRKELQKFNQKDIERYIKVLKNKGNSPATINNKLSYLSKCLNYYNNKSIVIPYQKSKSKVKSIITKEQFNNLHRYYYHSGQRELYNFICIAYYTGLRANEILNIERLHIKYGPETDTYYINLYNTKNHKDNYIPVSSKLNHIFNNFEEFTMNYKQVHYQLHLQGITAHQFRHTFITNAIERGIDIYTVMRLTNQSSLSVQARYAHIQNKHLNNVVNQL